MREDITEGRTGVPLQLLLTFVNVNDSCAPITDALIYTWHCDKDGIYSGYSQPGGNHRTSRQLCMPARCMRHGVRTHP